MSDLPSGISLLPSGRFHARFMYKGRSFRSSWDNVKQAEAWMQRTRRELAAGTYVAQDLADPETGKRLPPTFHEYSRNWIAERRLKPRTRAEYTRMLVHLQKRPVSPGPDRQRADQEVALGAGGPDVRKAHVYGLCRAILNGAIDDELIETNPCRIKGAGVMRRRSRTEVPNPDQVEALANAMPTSKYRAMVLLSAWCGLRLGETTELRVKDVVTAGDGFPRDALRVRRAVVHVNGKALVGEPKSEAGIRDVTIPPHIRGDFERYMTTLPEGSEQLLFPATRTGRHMRPSSLYKPFYKAREDVGLASLRWHDLRHYSATAAAQTGATIAEIQARIGHSTAAAMLTSMRPAVATRRSPRR